MVNKIKQQTTIKDCTIFKLGGSFAVSMSKTQLEKAGFCLGMPVDVTLKLYEKSLEPLPDYSDSIETIETLLDAYCCLDSLSMVLIIKYWFERINK
jgi:hypothetical protein